jgi:hypothetical protein
MSSSAGASTGECARPGVGEGREEYLARVLSVYRFDARITDKTADLSSRAKFKVRGKWVCGADEALVRRTKRAPHDTAEGTAALAMANIGEYVTRVLRERETGSSGGRKRAESADSKAAEPAEKTTPESFMALLQSKKPEQQPCTKASGASRRAGDKPFTLLKQNGKASGAQKRSADHATAAIKGAAAKERPPAAQVAVLKRIHSQLDPDVVRSALDAKTQGALLVVEAVAGTLGAVKKQRRTVDERAMQTAITTGAAGANDTQEESRLKAKALNQRSVSVAPASSARTHRNPRALTPLPAAAPPPPATAPPPPGPPAAAGRASCAAERRGELEQRQGCSRGFRPGSSRVPQSRT